MKLYYAVTYEDDGRQYVFDLCDTSAEAAVRLDDAIANHLENPKIQPTNSPSSLLT
jgi:hypothetical protein